MIFNKKAQLSDVMSWIVATLVIIVVLVFFIYASSLLAQKSKVVGVTGDNLVSGEEDYLESKTNIAHKISSQSQKEIIDSYLSANGGKNEN